MGFYSEKVVAHFKEPKNAGVLEDADGIGEMGDPTCGDFMRVFIKVEGNTITDVKYQMKGCPAWIAVASVMTELAIGKDIDDALMITGDDVLEALDGLPDGKLHYSVLGITGLRKAIQDHFMRHISSNSEEEKKIR
jgi:nitrogen fixation protein NifU and related proteins